MATNSAYYEQQLKAGQDYQDYVAEKLYHEGIVLVNFQGQRQQLDYGENLLGLEIKFDDQFERTGNLWIEVAEKRTPNSWAWVPSGIRRADRSWLYGIGNRREFFLFSKRTLCRIADNPTSPIAINNRQTSKGFLLSRPVAVDLADRLFAWPSEASA